MPMSEREKRAYEGCAREVFKEEGVPVTMDFMPSKVKSECDRIRLKMGDKAFFDKYGEDHPRR